MVLLHPAMSRSRLLWLGTARQMCTSQRSVSSTTSRRVLSGSTVRRFTISLVSKMVGRRSTRYVTSFTTRTPLTNFAQGMVKMYNAEVLSKFPVVQHFPFGSLFRWEKDPNARAPPPSTHVTSQPSAAAPPSMAAPAATRTPYMPTARPAPPSMPVTGAPWAQAPPTASPGTGAPWTQAPPTAMPFPRPTSGAGPMSAPPPTTRYAPSATARPGSGAADMQSANTHDESGRDGPPMTKAPWAR